MKHNPAFWRAFHSLTHPLSLLAIGLLLFNDHWLRHYHPSWLTGKLGDFTWLVFAPFIAGLVFAWLVPRRIKHHTQWVAGLSFAFIGIWFATAKTIPLVHQWTTDALAWLVGWRGTLRLDATDLLTLPALLIGWWIWTRVDDRPISLKPLGYVALGLGLLGTLASDREMQPPAIHHHLGVEQVCYYEDKLLVKSKFPAQGEHNAEYRYFLSDDGGLTWDWYRRTIEEDLIDCPEVTQLIADPSSPNIQNRWILNDRIERSIDSGVTWQTDYMIEYIDQEIRIYGFKQKTSYYDRLELSDVPISGIRDDSSENVIFAMGWYGVLVRTSDGEYAWGRVGEFGIDEIDPFSYRGGLNSILFTEICLSIATIFLVITTSTGYIRQKSISRIRRFALKFAWISLGILTLMLVGDHMGSLVSRNAQLSASSASFNSATLGFFIALVIGLPLSIGAVWDLLRNFRHLIFPILLVALGNGLLYIFPYILWSMGRIPRYMTAVGFVALLMVCGLTAGYKYLKPQLPIVEPEKGKRVEKAKAEKSKPTSK